jgi:RNA polymerase-binding transcription factor DksA
MNSQELRRYEDRLTDLRRRLTGEVGRLADALVSDVNPPGEHDQGVSEAVDKDLALEQNQQQLHQEVVAALERIEAGTYGRCVNCGEAIARPRLDALPYTPYCIRCEEKREADRGYPARAPA